MSKPTNIDKGEGVAHIEDDTHSIDPYPKPQTVTREQVVEEYSELTSEHMDDAYDHPRQEYFQNNAKEEDDYQGDGGAQHMDVPPFEKHNTAKRRKVDNTRFQAPPGHGNDESAISYSLRDRPSRAVTQQQPQYDPISPEKKKRSVQRRQSGGDYTSNSQSDRKSRQSSRKSKTDAACTATSAETKYPTRARQGSVNYKEYNTDDEDEYFEDEYEVDFKSNN
jgi:hypothetical protein